MRSRLSFRSLVANMSSNTAIVTLALLTVIAGSAAAHPAGYLATNACPGGLFTNGLNVGEPLFWPVGKLEGDGCVVVSNCTNDVLFTDHSLGGVRFCPGHMVPEADGTVKVAIYDDVSVIVGGSYCQDLNLDGICGGRDMLDPIGFYNEPYFYFCQVGTLGSPLVAGSKTTAQWASGDNWDATRDAFVFIDALGNGNVFRGMLPSDPVNSPGPIPPSVAGHTCIDSNPYHGGTRGLVYHNWV